MNRTATRLATLAATGAVIAALAVGGATAANAASPVYNGSPIIGTVVGTAVTSATNLPQYVKTSAACPATTNNIAGYIDSSASAGWAGIQAVDPQSFAAIATNGVALNNNLIQVAAANALTLANGHYDVAVVCFQDTNSTIGIGQFDGGFTVAGTVVTWDVPAMPASTTTVSITPATADTATAVQLHATVASTGAPISGTVNFTENGTTIASGVVAAGAASANYTFTTAGTHTVNATFAPDGASGAAGSSSTAGATVTITQAPMATTTVLSTSAVNPTTADIIPLTATVSPAAAAGSVTFTEVGGTYTQTAAINGGVASVSLSNVTAATHTYHAVFTGTAPYTNSTATDLVITVTQYTGSAASEQITTSIAAGTLTITAAGGTVNLGQLALDSTATKYQSGAPVSLQTITITDTRAGAKKWDASGVVTDFVGVNTSAQINSGNLGWVPQVLSQGTGQNVQAGATVPVPATPVNPGVATTSGLRTSKPLANAAAGASVGTATVTAGLSLVAPTTTVADTFNATLTLTAI